MKILVIEFERERERALGFEELAPIDQRKKKGKKVKQERDLLYLIVQIF